MAVYAVFLNNADEIAWKSLRELWPSRHYILSENMAFVSPEDLSTTSEISNSLDIGEQRSVQGIVFEIAAYTGFNRGDLWEWLGNVQS